MSDAESSTSPSDATEGGPVAEGRAVHAQGELGSGSEVGRYVLLRPLASGGMGIVYLAFDPELDRNVALKLVLPRRRARVDEPEALVAEARALAKLSHPNVIQVYDVGRWGERVYVALEYVEGRTLDAWLRATTRTPREILDVLLDAGRGLAAAHHANMVHLDIKPSNILIGDDGVVRVVDFGLARSAGGASLESGGSGESGAGRAVGTVGYIAPELFLGQHPDARSDQFGFCVTAWEALTGARPFAGRTRQEYERAVLDAAPAPGPGQASARILAVLRTGLSRRPSSRMPDMDALLRALATAGSPWTRGRTLGAIGAAAGLCAAVLFWRGDRVDAPCDGDDPLAAVWNDARTTEIAESFAATGLPYAVAAWTATHDELAMRVAQWQLSHRENCLATRVHQTRPVAALERSQSCLDARREEIDALMGLFERADAQTVEHAAAAARALPASARCLDDAPVAAAGSDRDATSEDDGELADGLGRQLAEAWALNRATRYEAALEVATRVAEEAKRARLSAVEARAYLLGGHASGRLGRVKEAQALLELGVRTADGAGADDDRITGLNDLVYTVGHLGGDPKRGHWFARMAEALLERLGGRASEAMVLLLYEAVLFADEGRLDESLATYLQALSVWESGERVLDESLAALFNNLGSVHVSRGEHGAAAVWFLHSYLLRVALAGPEHPAVADVLVNWGNVMWNLGHPQLALDHNLHALTILENARGRDDPNARVVLNNIAVILQDLGRSTEARAYSLRALDLWRALDAESPMAAVAQANLAEADLLVGDARVALSAYREAYASLTRALPAGHPYITNALGGIGRALLALGDARAAIPILRHAIEFGVEGDAPGEMVAETRFALARALAAVAADPGLILGLARQARQGYVDLGLHGAKKAAAIEAWTKQWRVAHARD